MSKAEILREKQSKFKKKGMRTSINIRATEEMRNQILELQKLLNLRTRTDALRCAVLTALDIARKEAGK